MARGGETRGREERECRREGKQTDKQTLLVLDCFQTTDWKLSYFPCVCVCVRASVLLAEEQEEEFRHYCASLLALPASGGSAEPEVTSPESFLTIEVLNEVSRRTEEEQDTVRK